MLHILPTIHHLLAASKSYTKKIITYLLTGKIKKKFWSKKSPENRPLSEKGQDRESNKTRWKNKRGGRKMESNHSPEIPNEELGGGVRGGIRFIKPVRSVPNNKYNKN